jgi:hypothetical protein
MDKTKINEIEVNGVQYVPKASVAESNFEEAERLNGLQYVIVRTYSAGVFAGYLNRRDGKEVELFDARRIWWWEGAASLSQLSQEGTSKPDECKFPCEVNSIILTEAIEIIPCTIVAQQSIKGVKIWVE